MEIQQKDNRAFAVYIQHFQTAAKQCAFDNKTVTVKRFVKEHWDVPTMTAKIYKKDS